MMPDRSDQRRQVQLLERGHLGLPACSHEVLVVGVRVVSVVGPLIGEVHGELERVIALWAHLAVDDEIANARDRAKDGASGITGTVPVNLKTVRTIAPALPASVTTLRSDGTRGTAAVTWDAIPAASYATATTPYADGPARGIFTVTGTVTGTTAKATARVTVMPKLAADITSTYSYDPNAPGLPPVTFTNVTFDAGAGVTFKRQVYVRWDQKITVTAGSPTQTLTGTIAGHPWEKAKATVTIKSPDLAQEKPTTSFWNLAKNPASLAVDGDPATNWKTGGSSDGSFSDGTPTSTNGSLCGWFYVDRGSVKTVHSIAIQWGEDVTSYGNMFDASYDIQVVPGDVFPSDPALKNSTCSRTGGSANPTTAPADDIWTTVVSGTGTRTLDTVPLPQAAQTRSSGSSRTRRPQHTGSERQFRSSASTGGSSWLSRGAAWLGDWSGRSAA